MAGITAQELNVILSARDREFTKAMDRAQRRVERFAKRSEKELSKTSQSFSVLTGMAGKLGAALASGGLITGFGRLVKTATDAAVEFDNLSRIAGVNVERFQEMSFAAKRFGVDQSKLADILKDVNDKFGDFFQTGAGPMVDFFEQIAPKVGLTAKEFEGLSSDQALGKYVKALQDANVSQQELTFYLEAIASDATLLAPLFLNNAEQLERMAAAGRDLGVVMSTDMITNAVAMRRTFDEVMDVMTAKFTNFALTVVSGFDEIFNITNAEKLQEINEEIQEIMQSNAQISERIRKNQQGESKFPSEERRQKDLQVQLDKLAANNAQLNALREQDQVLRDQIASADRLKATLDNLSSGGSAGGATGSKGTSTTPGDGDKPGPTQTHAQALAQMGRTRIMAAREAAKAAAEETAEAEADFAAKMSEIFAPFLTETADNVFEQTIQDLTPVEQRIAQIKRERDQMIADAKAAYAEAGKELEGFDLVKIENIAYAWAHSEIQAAKYADTQSAALTEGEIKALQAAEALRIYTQQVEALGLQVSEFEELGRGMQNAMENAFMSMIDGTASAGDAFKAMARQIIADLFRVLVVQRMVGSFGTATSAGTGLLGGIGEAFGITGAAQGGPIQAGQPYTVGEHGREIFVPNQGGRILSVPQSKAAVSGGGGSEIVVNQTINVSTGVQQTVRTEIKSLMPQIADSAKNAVLDAKRRGGTYGRSF